MKQLASRTFAARDIAEPQALAAGLGERAHAATVADAVAGAEVVLVAVPGPAVIDMLKAHVGCETLGLATEKEFIERFPGCQPGAMPPFGKLFGLPLYCDSALSEELEIEFNAGTHVDTIRMNFAGFNKLENPVLLSFSEKRTGQQVPRSA